ncbi:hypothetical protein ATCC90586_005217 [Pythium insidiosum]|nr:hypothetical protein ATCC90586_005217 [Pythium insidiosum]
MKELQSCDSSIGVCISFTDKVQLHCVDSTEVENYKKYDACDDKRDGDSCRPFVVAGNRLGTFALYEGKRGVCKDHVCLPERTATCLEKSDGDTCSFIDSEYGFWLQGKGKCRLSDDAPAPLRSCTTPANEHVPSLGPQAPIQVYDNRPNVSNPTNVETADLCNILPRGTPCKDAKSDTVSRCSNKASCASPPSACPAGAMLLDKCQASNTAAYCFEYLVEGQLSKDDDPCTDFDFSIFRGTLSFFEVPKGRCYRQACQSQAAQACEFLRLGDACTAAVLRDDQIVQINATCESSVFYLECKDTDPSRKATALGSPVSVSAEILVVKAVKPELLRTLPPAKDKESTRPPRAVPDAIQSSAGKPALPAHSVLQHGALY